MNRAIKLTIAYKDLEDKFTKVGQDGINTAKKLDTCIENDKTRDKTEKRLRGAKNFWLTCTLVLAAVEIATRIK